MSAEWNRRAAKHAARKVQQVPKKRRLPKSEPVVKGKIMPMTMGQLSLFMQGTP